MGCQEAMRINKKLVPVKATYFFTLGGVASLLPYLAVYMMQIGLSASEMAIIYGTMPFLGAFVRMLVGAIADKLRKHKATLLVCCLLSGVFHGCLLLVPSRTGETEISLEVTLKCSSEGSYLDLCTNGKCDSLLVVNNQTVSSNVQDILANSSECTLSCCDNFDSFCASNQTPPSEICLSATNETEKSCHEFNIKQLGYDSQTYNSNTTCAQYSWEVFHYNSTAFSTLTCPQSSQSQKCHLQCKNNFLQGDNSCYSVKETQKVNPEKFEKTFWMFFTICLVGQMFFAPIFSLVDAMTYDYLGADGGKWGQQRTWGSVGFGIFAVISGLTMDIYKNDGGEKNYTFAFVAFAVLSIFAGIMVCFYKISQEFQCKQIFKNVGSLLKTLEVVMLLLAMFVYGMYTGLIEAFLYWHLALLGGTQLLNGLCMLVNCIPEVFVLLFAGPLINRIGHINCLYIAFVAYGVRLTAYSFLSNPWLVLFIEPLQAVCFGLMYAAASSYASQLTPPGLSGTIQGVIGALYFGAGKGTGSVVGGLIFERYGAVITFQSYGVSAFIFLVIFFLVQFFILRPKRLRRQAQKDSEAREEPKIQEMEEMLNNKEFDEKLEPNSENIHV